MTKLLQQAFEAAARLPAEEQDRIGALLLEEFADESAFDAKITATADKLLPLSERALADLEAGRTEDLDPDRL